MSKMTENGISTCTGLGQEKYEYFKLLPKRRSPKNIYCQYDYRHTNNELFSTIAPTLEQCRERRDEWLKKHDY